MNQYICPGCLFLGKQTLLYESKFLNCQECTNKLKESNDIKLKKIFEIFYKHHKSGYRCTDCSRFIPLPADYSSNISCPYLDCCFIGDSSEMKKMHHPAIKTNETPEKLILSNNRKDLISTTIDTLSKELSFSSSNFTTHHKLLVYQAFNNLLNKFPEEMENYLLNESRTGGFQHKAFQEYIRLLEDSFPFSIRKNKKFYTINNLLDENLCLFEGASSFEAIVNDKGIIPNNTKEFYFGGRKATYAKPYYMGKLLNVVEAVTKQPLMHLVEEYTFNKIKIKDIVPGTNVIVTHLRIPPHYEMGGMVYVNRIRKKIVEEISGNLK